MADHCRLQAPVDVGEETTRLLVVDGVAVRALPVTLQKQTNATHRVRIDCTKETSASKCMTSGEMRCLNRTGEQNV